MSDNNFLNDNMSFRSLFRRRSKKRKRLRFILSMVFAYGFEEVAIRLGFPTYGFIRRIFANRKEARHSKDPLSVRLRLLLEELGPTFIKLGQILSLRSDLLPDEITNELRKLQTEVLPFSGEDALAIVEKELGASAEQLFRSFDTKPIASASISQVHSAVTRAGRKVAVKVQRPDAQETIRNDVALMYDVARLSARHIPSARFYKPVEVVEQFDRTLATELDFTNEARTMGLFRDLFKGSDGIYIAEVLPEMTTSRVLTMEHLDGIGLDTLPKLDEVPFSRKTVARRGTRYLLDQIFEIGIFNADPHPGNFLVLRDSVLAPIDFGMTGSVDTLMKAALLDAIEAFLRRQPDRLFRVFERLNLIGDDANALALRHDLTTLVNFYYNVPLARINADQLLGSIISLIRRYQISIPVDMVLIFKVIITLEALAKELDPEFNIFHAFRPFLLRQYANTMNPLQQGENLETFTRDLFETAKTLPYDIGLVLNKLHSGKLHVQMEHQDLLRTAGLVGRSLNRLAFAMIITGLLIGSSLMTHLPSMPHFFGLPILSFGGYVISGILGLWLIISVIRSHRV